MRMTKWFALAIGALALGACQYTATPDPLLSAQDSNWMAMVPKAEVDLPFERYMISDPTGQPPGTIVVDTKSRFLYYVLPNKKAIRYGVAVGDEAFGWTGTAVVERKSEWPRWIPPKEMVERWPHLKPYADGMPGGPGNPLGARALYLYSNGKDTLYRIHGTNEPDSIGQAVSSGCIRMRNIDVVDLYNRANVGAKVIVE